MPALPVRSNLRLSLLTLLAALFVTVADARAELVWTAKNVELPADAATAVAEARFPFKNHGLKPVEVTQVMSSCGCTTVALEKRHYEPGESGEIVARYTLGEHTGLQKKSVLVTTSDGVEPVELTLSVRIPEVLRITPGFVTWKHNEAPTPKQITFEMAQEIPLNEISVQSSNPSVSTELSPVIKGKKYLLTVNPGQTTQHSFATLIVHTRFGETARDFRTYATVQPPVREE